MNASAKSPDIEMEYSEYRYPDSGAAHRGILQNFTNAILYGVPLIAPGTDGIKEIEISNAVYLSAWKGSQAVQIPVNRAEFNKRLDELKTSNAEYEKSESEYHTEYDSRWETKW